MQTALVGLTSSRLALLSFLLSVVRHPVKAFLCLFFAVVGLEAYPSFLLSVVR